MPLIPFVTGQKTTAAAVNAALDTTRVAHQTTDQGSSSTTFVSSTSMVLSVEAGVNYRFQSKLFFNTNTTADFKMNLLLPAGSTVRLGDSTGSNSTSLSRAYGSLAGENVESPGGYIDIDTSAGNLTLQFAQNSASGTTTLRVGSWIELTKLTI